MKIDPEAQTVIAEGIAVLLALTGVGILLVSVGTFLWLIK